MQQAPALGLVGGPRLSFAIWQIEARSWAYLLWKAQTLKFGGQLSSTFAPENPGL